MSICISLSGHTVSQPTGKQVGTQDWTSLPCLEKRAPSQKPLKAQGETTVSHSDPASWASAAADGAWKQARFPRLNTTPAPAARQSLVLNKRPKEMIYQDTLSRQSEMACTETQGCDMKVLENESRDMVSSIHL